MRSVRLRMARLGLAVLGIAAWGAGQPARSEQPGCAGYMLGQEHYEQVVRRLTAEGARYQEAAEGLRCPQRFRLLIVTLPVKCEGLPLMAIGTGMMFAEDSGELVSVGLMFPYSPGFQRALLSGLRQQLTELLESDIPEPIRRADSQSTLTAAFSGDGLIVSLEQPARGSRGAPMSIVTYMLPAYVEMSRQDMSECR
jgi:hypothetical protein